MLDISARGINCTFERFFYDVRVSHPHCASNSNVTLSLSELYEKNEKGKDLKYTERVQECEKGSFTPLVFLPTGVMAQKCTKK
jgi:hypothetical protein